jgi:anti-sigma B factor antagonist
MSTRTRDDPILSVTLLGGGPAKVIAVAGEIDISHVHLLTDLADCLLASRPLPLVLDLAQVNFCGAAGVNALLRIRHAVTAAAGQLVLRDPSPIVLTVLTMAHVVNEFQIHPTTTTGTTSREDLRQPSLATSDGS